MGLLSPRPDAPFVVSNGDVLTDIRYGELLDFHCRHGAAATMAVRLHEWQHPFGVVRTKGVDIIGFEEKPIARSHINAGVYALDPGALEVLSAGIHCDMPTLFSRLQAKPSARSRIRCMSPGWTWGRCHLPTSLAELARLGYTRTVHGLKNRSFAIGTKLFPHRYGSYSLLII